MNEQTLPFAHFLPGSHLILGEAGSGKSKLIWSTLQTPEFSQNNAVNIVLSDASQRIPSDEALRNPVRDVEPYNTDITWITRPSVPGVYYCSCDYAPRVITFLECFATWALQAPEEGGSPVRLFLDFSAKCWSRPEFVEQLARLYYIATNRENIEIWAVIGAYKKVSLLARALFEKTSLVFLNPFPAGLIDEICDALGLKRDTLPGLALVTFERKTGFYYIPYNEEAAYWKQ
ncbi:MAG: hypothetical protein LBL37_04870 [Gracilibacteraceae bacterium]|jgi:hypothetical protein|nr:hypothetical protein [Gracilibacteraceae bacterium]